MSQTQIIIFYRQDIAVPDKLLKRHVPIKLKPRY